MHMVKFSCWLVHSILSGVVESIVCFFCAADCTGLCLHCSQWLFILEAGRHLLWVSCGFIVNCMLHYASLVFTLVWLVGFHAACDFKVTLSVCFATLVLGLWRLCVVQALSATTCCWWFYLAGFNWFARSSEPLGSGCVF